ncbi:ATP phosphoribosyltransferase regulatory subunit [Virgibacillus sp. 179-BFC.A HS]|uniref:ATP phosphoribosyltransferase regulatory subunit n=1 Tax=Tigheibacillus jepli TaxID=3035914 RepID=A0ABU5CKE0_9BACI|nr:ATP phosphoribosyltransferase regulatory subunit [Virgibacillus sp. 179-BFC.A HS]MDY0406821.1 ATP phosphoribosyltransferase regulatory subunit [Virgibacillus sp. 179-BFC.A HS]
MEIFSFDQTEANQQKFQVREHLLDNLKKRFSLHGYQQIRTSTFEPYELYSNQIGTIPQASMIKVIDPSGKVLVLRPDATIPVTKEVAGKYDSFTGHIRYFYVLDVFRQSFYGNGGKERTQAGVECFGEKSAAIDAEVIALAIQTLQDIGATHFKIEIGHANFFKQLLAEIALPEEAMEQLKATIQAKNIADIGPLLESFAVDPSLVEKVSQIPFLYGHPKEVMERAQNVLVNEKMRAELNSLWDVYEMLCTYGVGEHIVFDLGLINHMNYYSDIIFQGFVEQVARPVLMGGRYDRLAEQFGEAIPAIGFASDVDALLAAAANDRAIARPADITVVYETSKLTQALALTSRLRDEGGIAPLP